MRKISFVIAVLLAFAMLSGCGTQETETETPQTTVATAEEQFVRIAIPKDSLEDAESFVKSMKEYGAEVNDITGAEGYLFVFSKEEHKKLLDDKYAETVKKLKEYEDDETYYIDTIEYDEDFRNMTFNVDKELYDTTGSTTGNIVVAAVALSYQIYLEDGQKTDVEVVYSGTEDVITTFSLPMSLSVAQ